MTRYVCGPPLRINPTSSSRVSSFRPTFPPPSISFVSISSKSIPTAPDAPWLACGNQGQPPRSCCRATARRGTRVAPARTRDRAVSWYGGAKYPRWIPVCSSAPGSHHGDNEHFWSIVEPLRKLFFEHVVGLAPHTLTYMCFVVQMLKKGKYSHFCKQCHRRLFPIPSPTPWLFHVSYTSSK